jgi:hypothetical protein
MASFCCATGSLAAFIDLLVGLLNVTFLIQEIKNAE